MATFRSKKSKTEDTIGTRIPSIGMNEKSSISAKPSTPPSSMKVVCGRYSGRPMTRSEWISRFGSMSRTTRDTKVLKATNGMAMRLKLTIWATACWRAFGVWLWKGDGSPPAIFFDDWRSARHEEPRMRPYAKTDGENIAKAAMLNRRLSGISNKPNAMYNMATRAIQKPRRTT